MIGYEWTLRILFLLLSDVHTTPFMFRGITEFSEWSTNRDNSLKRGIHTSLLPLKQGKMLFVMLTQSNNKIDMIVASGRCDYHTMHARHGHSLILLQCKDNSAMLNAFPHCQNIQTSNLWLCYSHGRSSLESYSRRTPTCKHVVPIRQRAAQSTLSVVQPVPA